MEQWDIDQYFMQIALKEAEKAAYQEEVPVGAVAVKGVEILAKAHNQRETLQDPTAHAEILALTQAAAALSSWRLEGVTLYVTLEPCPMCAGALVLSRIQRLVFGAYDPKGGAAGSLYNIPEDPRLNHRVEVQGGILQQECADLLRTFFQKKRRKKTKT